MSVTLKAASPLDWAGAQRINLLIFVAVALLGLAFGQQFSFLIGTCVYTLCCGNLTFLLAPLLFRRAARYQPAQALLFIVVSGLIVGAIGSVVAAAVLGLLHAYPNYSFRRGLIDGGRLALVVTPVTLIVIYFYDRSRTALEGRAAELEKAVESGSARLRLQDAEFEKAREIQQGLLPKEIAQIRGYQVTGAWQPAQAVGGDYYDVLSFGDSALGVAIGDVVGKGISAALLMANLQAAVRAYAGAAVEPRVVCEQINTVICGNIALGKFITFFYGVLDGPRRKLAYCNAGHNPPFLVRGSDKLIKLDQGGALLGIFPKWVFEQETIDLLPGDRLVLYTDGVTEAENEQGEEFGEERLEQLLREFAPLSAADIETRLLQAVTRFCSGNFRDDATLLVIAVR